MHCPVCGNDVERVHRHPLERLLSIFYSVHRYRCVNPECGWEGSLHRDGRQIADRPGAALGSRLIWFALGATTLYAGQQAADYYYERLQPSIDAIPMFALYDEPHHRTVEQGVDDPGHALEPHDPRAIENLASLNIRKGCFWGVPGGNPYKGSVKEALIGTKIPTEVILKLDYKVQHKLVSDQLTISNAGIMTENGARNFGTTAASMAFGNTLCFNTRVNFREGHVEKADLYEATDSKGQGYAIMVPYVCGNVSVLDERMRRNGRHNGGTVPEPSVWLLLVLALLIALFVLHRRTS